MVIYITWKNSNSPCHTHTANPHSYPQAYPSQTYKKSLCIGIQAWPASYRLGPIHLVIGYVRSRNVWRWLGWCEALWCVCGGGHGSANVQWEVEKRRERYWRVPSVFRLSVYFIYPKFVSSVPFVVSHSRGYRTPEISGNQARWYLVNSRSLVEHTYYHLTGGSRAFSNYEN